MQDGRANPGELNIGHETVLYRIVKAREFDAEAYPAGVDTGSNLAENAGRVSLENSWEDTATHEFQAAFDQMTAGNVIDLIALAWIGWGDLDRSG
ncbi:hypothetical protein [Microvirga terrestris]|uniref:Uncharacterized protein n=1 Tax=Microvirga terrestris TaxID=2791024 RepID=A0ABS0HTX5_9HYPH|nr:hypothetical protein [Microvirga terrestris]MBF9196946.1 hypothetical protein [Microvirga terrestris]